MRSEIWITSLLFWGIIKADSWEWEENEDNFPCIPVGYKCYTSNDCCSGATCVSAKWSSHLVCLVAGYKEDIKLERIGRRKEVQPQDLEYLKNMYGFTADYYRLENPDGLSTLELFPETTPLGVLKDLENQDRRSTVEPLPEITPLGLLKDLENQDRRSTVEPLPEITPLGVMKDLENQAGRSTVEPLPEITPLGLLKDLENQDRRSTVEPLPEITPLGLLKDLENQDRRSTVEPLPEITPLGLLKDLENQAGRSTVEPLPEITPLGLLKDLENQDRRSTVEPLPEITPLGLLKDLENQDRRSTVEPLPEITPLGLLKDLENQDRRSTVEPLPETPPLDTQRDLENQDEHFTLEPFTDATPFPPSSVTNRPLIGSTPLMKNSLKLPESFLAYYKDKTAPRYDIDELNNFKTFLDEISEVSDDFTNKENSKYVPSKRNNGEESFKETKEKIKTEYTGVEEIRNKRSYDEPFSDKKEDKVKVDEYTEESQYSESYIDPFSSYLDNTNQGTLIDNITSQIKPESEFKPISYSSLEHLLQNLTGYEFYLPNFTWPFRYNETSTTVTPIEPVTISKRLWNLSINPNVTKDYPDLDFGETYNILNGHNYSDDWLLGETKHDGFGDSINFNLTSFNKFMSSLSFGFFKDKNTKNVSISPSTWQKLLRFVHSEKKNSTKLDLNSTIVVLKKNRTTWKILTDLFRTANESIKINLIPRNDSDSNGTDAVVDLINNFRNCGIASNISCLLMSIIDSNGTKLTRFDDEDEKNWRKENAQRLWRKAGDDVRKDNLLKSKRFVDVVTLVKNSDKVDNKLGKWEKFKRLFKSDTDNKTSGVKILVSEFNETSIDDKKWWTKFKNIFKKSHEKDLNISKSEFFLNLEPLPELFNVSLNKVENLIDNDTVQLNFTDNSNLWNKIKNVLFKTSKIQPTTISPQYNPGNVSNFMRRYLEWSADRKHPNRIKLDGSDDDPGFYSISSADNLKSAKNRNVSTVGKTGIEEVGFWNRYPPQVTEDNYYDSYSDEGLLKDIDGNFFKNSLSSKETN